MSLALRTVPPAAAAAAPPRSGYSLLELLHPDGAAEQALVIGSGCPEVLRPEGQAAPGGPVDLAIVAPTGAECRQPGWLEAAAVQVQARLDADGIGYLLVPRRWRAGLAFRLAREGLRVVLACAHLPTWESSRRIVPLQPGPAAYALSAPTGKLSWRQALARAGLRLPAAGRLAGAGWPSAGLVVRRPGARPLWEWLFAPTQAASSRRGGSGLVQQSWRGRAGPAVVYRFPAGASRPDAIAKIPSGEDAGAREARAIAGLGPGGRAAGASIPRLLAYPGPGARPALILSPLAGQPAGLLLQARPDLLAEVGERVVAWLERWHRLTRVVRPAPASFLESRLLEPAAHLAPALEGGGRYLAWLERRAAEVAGSPEPFTAAHQDLTAANLLVGPGGRLGVLDWETAQNETFPLVDFFYALTDAALAARPSQGRLAAFQACFTPAGGEWAGQVKAWQARLAAAVAADPAWIGLCFQACWLSHAWNERRSTPDSSSQPFFQIVQWIAGNLSFENHLFG